MRTEKEMYALILDFAKADERVRGVMLNGSRANPNAPRDPYQDYDIVYVVEAFDTFIANHGWIDVFGKRLMLQMPEAMCHPSGEGHFNWMMLLDDGNRIDLTLIPIQKKELVGNDSLSVILLDKDGLLPRFPASSDADYFVKPPSELLFFSCCNNFWWCLQNVAKGIARDEMPYAMMMYHTVVREELHNMIDWYIGTTNAFSVSAGKMGKYYRRYLPEQLYQQYCDTYSNAVSDDIWKSLLVMCDLVHALTQQVASFLGVSTNPEDERGMRAYIDMVRSGLPYPSTQK